MANTGCPKLWYFLVGSMYVSGSSIWISTELALDQVKRELKNTAIPKTDALDELHSCGLAITNSDTELQFDQSWTHEECTSWLRKLLPNPFEYQASRSLGKNSHPEEDWRLVIKADRSSLAVLEGTGPTGQDLLVQKGRWKAGIKDSRICISESHTLFEASPTDMGYCIAFLKAIQPKIYKSWCTVEDDDISEEGPEAAPADNDDESIDEGDEDQSLSDDIAGPGLQDSDVDAEEDVKHTSTRDTNDSESMQ